MKTDNHILTIEEAEQLCRLYMDCGLTVREETELEYVLAMLTYSSPLIDEVRVLMGIQTAIGLSHGDTLRDEAPHSAPEGEVLSPGVFGNRRSQRRRWLWPIGIAASLVLVFGLAMRFPTKGHGGDSLGSGTDHEMVIAYEGGVRLDGEAAEAAVARSMRHAEALIAQANARINEEKLRKDRILKLLNQ